MTSPTTILRPARKPTHWRGVLLALTAGCLMMACNLNGKTDVNHGGGNGGAVTTGAGGVDLNDPAAVAAAARKAILENRLQAARDLLTPLIEKDASNATAYSLRGIAYIREGKVYPAVRDLKAAADLAPTATNYFNLGNALQQTGFYRRAATAYSAALELAPDDPEILNNYGNSLMFSDRVGEARGIFQRVIQLRPGDPEAYVGLGMTYHRDKDYDAAEAQFFKALEVDPQYWAAQFNLAKNYDVMGDDAMASEHYKRYLQMRPDAPDKTKILNRAGLLPEDLQM